MERDFEEGDFKRPKKWLHLVPVRCDHQVLRVLGVLLIGNDSPHMYRVRTIENKMIPQ